MSEHPRTLVAVATYNEIENLPRLTDEIFAHASHADLLVVDDNSPDGTGRWCDSHAAGEPRLHVIHRAGKLGLGTATLEAMQYALRREYDLLVTLDADFSHPPAKIPDLIGRMTRAEATPVDVVVGSRYIAGGGVQGWPLRRRVMSRLVNTYARILLRLPIRDCSGAFRCYRTSILHRLDLSQMRSHGYSYLEEILWMLKYQQARFAEIPFVFVDRTEGHSKINLREAWWFLWIVLRLAFSRPAARVQD
jgi:dolichol-phosphate mannosyltransferase